MKHISFIKSLLIVAAMGIMVLFSKPLTAQDTGTMIVHVSELENYDGSLRLSLFNQEDGFPQDPLQAYHILLHPVEGEGKQIILIDSIPFGNYAISIHHDEDDDMEFRTNWLGMPKEGIGTSNGAKGFMGPPKYKDAEFSFEEDKQVVPVKMVYL